MSERIDSIATTHLGITYRSILECKWAQVFAMLGLTAHYEPITLGNYIPDFILDANLYAGSHRQPVTPLLVEIKPHLVPEDYRETINTIARSGWTGAALVLGACIRKREFWSEEMWCGYGHPSVKPSHAESIAHDWFQVGWSGPESKDAPNMFAMGGKFDLTKMWREAGRRTQWLPDGR